MAYTRPWDEATPAGTAAASDLDTFLQHIKGDVRERIEQVIPGWGDNSEDPKRVVIGSGDVADRPDSGDSHKGELFFAEDEGLVYIFDGTNWLSLDPVLVGPLSERPTASGAGKLFYATDENILYLEAGGSWVAVTSAASVITPVDFSESQEIPVGESRDFVFYTENTTHLPKVIRAFEITLTGPSGARTFLTVGGGFLSGPGTTTVLSVIRRVDGGNREYVVRVACSGLTSTVTVGVKAELSPISTSS